MTRRLAAIVGIVLTVAGCASWEDFTLPSGFVDGKSLHHLNVGGRDRSYRLYKPAGLPASAGLVVVMHGYSGSAALAERYFGWDGLADSGKFVAVYPDGLNRAWNVGGENCCGRPAREGVDDVGFISAAVADVAHNVGVSPDKVYATGMSNGAIMSYTLACTTDIFAAIGPVAGIPLSACASPHPASLMHIHGTADRLVPYRGGQGFSVINGPPVPHVNEFWREVDQCEAPAIATKGPVTTSTANCAQGRGVVLVTVDGGGHEWPAFASPMLWQFFATHPR